MSLITLTTDFGTTDWFVGTMKGVIAGIAPAARLTDITHKVPPGHLLEGAFALTASTPYFPEGTIHVAVVDPGVGSARRAIALRTARAVFIGPDNGVLSWAVREETVIEARSLTNTKWFLDPVSQTFHGRDVFAPVAARLANGESFADVGELIDDFVRLPWPKVTQGINESKGEIVYIDRFGNSISNLPIKDFPAQALADCTVEARCGGKSASLRHCYTDVPRGRALAIAGSSGLLELAINGDDFAEQHGIELGSPVNVRW